MNDQAEKLRQQLNRPKGGKTIAVVSGKGGVGKSNFAVNFSLELIHHQKRVLLFDLDVGMGNIDILLGLHANLTVVDMLEKNISIHSIIEKGPLGLSYISGGSALTDFFTMDQQKKDYFYEQYEQLMNHYDYIIFDMGAGVTSESLFFTLAADECIVMTTPEPTSITDAYGMIKFIIHNERKMPIYVVMNRCQSQKHGKNALDKFHQVVAQFLQINIKRLGMLPEDKMVSTAVMKQTPYILFNERLPVSKALKEIVHHYMSVTNGVNLVKPVSFIQKLNKLLKGR